MTPTDRQQRAERVRQRCDLNKQYRDEARLLSNSALADKFEVHYKHISRILGGRHWSKESAIGVKLTADDVGLIRQLAAERDRLKSLAAEHSHKRIAEDEGMSLVMVNQISMGLKWGNDAR